MAIVINGSGTVTGLAVGGLPDGTVDSGTIATGTIVDADVANVAASKLTGALPAISAANLTAIPAANITGTLPAISGANLTGITTGKVLQVVSHFITSAINLNSSSYASVISKAITPVAASSTFVIFTTVDGVYKDATSNYIRGKLTRSGTGVSGGASFINVAKLWDHYGYYGLISSAIDLGTLTNVCHDNPSYSLGNTITYGVDARRFDGSGTIQINKWGESTTSILIMEIGA